MEWAIKEDLYARYGQEFVTKLAIRRNWDATLQDWVADVSELNVGAVVNLALEDAKNLILQKLNCLYSNVTLLDTINCPVLKIWHIKLAIEVLKAGGDCTACDCKTFDEFLSCNKICDENGNCLISNKSFITVSDSCFPCEACGCDGCCCGH